MVDSNTNIMYNLAIQYFKTAQELEIRGKIEEAFRNYRESANKFLFLVKNEQNANQLKEYQDMTKKAIDQGAWLKLQIDEQKVKMKATMQKSEAPLTLGLQLLGPNYMEAFNFYWNLGEFYFSLVSKNKGILSASKACYVIAAENLFQINLMIKDENQKKANNKKIQEIIAFAEGLKQKINSDVACDAKKAALAQYDAKEQTIIEAGSYVRGGRFDVWSPEKGITNIFSSVAYEDPEGLLPLSIKQMKHFNSWVRPIEVIDRDQYAQGRPDIATQISGYEVMQRKIGDCSVLSSLAVAAHYEWKTQYQKKVISCLIYPQDQHGNPIYNPCGHYIVKLFINGIWRPVEIDDYLPIDSYGNFICAYSNKGKLWVSLLEKAYLKVHGGYEFIGSNSSRDLYTLTGWLPEKIDLKSYNRQKLWDRIRSGYRNNDCLITIGTGLVEDEDSVGLVSNHAYGVLEIFEYGLHKILLVKNPWGHFRWNGKFSTEDRINWTPELKAALHYEDLKSSDNGIFWIDIDSVCEWFETIDINWNPELLIYRKSFFDIWKVADMSSAHSFSIKDNPQFGIKFQSDGTDTFGGYDTIITWVCISKMLIKQAGINEDEEKAPDYIAMHVYPNAHVGKKILEDRNAIVKSVYTNEQNYMLYLELPAKDYYNQQTAINLVLDQHLREKDLFFNIRVLSNCPFHTKRAAFDFKYKNQIAIPNMKSGGVPNSPYFYTNPQFYFYFDKSKIPNAHMVQKIETLITFKSDYQSDVKLFLCNAENAGQKITTLTEQNLIDPSQKTSFYKPVTAHMHYKLNPSDFYIAILSTFKAEMSIGGTLTFESDQPLVVKEMNMEGAGMKKIVIQDEWDFNNAGGCNNFGMYEKNPAFALNIPDDGCDLQVRLRVVAEVAPDGVSLITDSEHFSFCPNAAVFRVQSNRYPPPQGSIQIKQLTSPILNTFNGKYSNNLSAIVSERKRVSKGVYVVVPSTFNPQQLGKFELIIYSSAPNIDYARYQ